MLGIAAVGWRIFDGPELSKGLDPMLHRGPFIIAITGSYVGFFFFRISTRQQFRTSFVAIGS